MSKEYHTYKQANCAANKCEQKQDSLLNSSFISLSLKFIVTGNNKCKDIYK